MPVADTKLDSKLASFYNHAVSPEILLALQVESRGNQVDDLLVAVLLDVQSAVRVVVVQVY